MKYFIVTGNMMFKTAISNQLQQQKIVHKVISSFDEFELTLEERGNKTFFLDHNFSTENIEDLAEKILGKDKENILITFGEELPADSIVSLFRAGVSDIFAEPFIPSDLIDKAIKIKKTSDKDKKIQEKELKETVKTESQKKNENTFKPIGRSLLFNSLLGFVEKISTSDATVMISGESGTGKEVIAKYIHLLSNRKLARFVAVNCGAIPESLMESELFGYKKGAFTGAFSDKKGFFEEAIDGTIFLDEIGELPLHLQVKLLRVLQEKEIQPLGSTDIISVNPRVITATNKDLAKEVETGNFREDLYYRLNVIPIRIPALRERCEDIDALAYFFLDRYCEKYSKDIKGFSKDCIEKMEEYKWPGNVRELENTIERMVVVKDSGHLQKDDLPPKLSGIEINPFSMLFGQAISPDTVSGSNVKKSNIRNIDWENIFIPEDFCFDDFMEKVQNSILKTAIEQSENSAEKASELIKKDKKIFINIK